jgi:hypothetical protein
MCVIAAKYFDKVGWVAGKNRDRNYKPTIAIRQSYRKGIERMYMFDKKTKYTEGLNEHGIAILSSAVAVKKDEKEGFSNPDKVNNERYDLGSPDGKKIRTALLESTLKGVIRSLIESQIPGNTLVFTKDKCFLIEGVFTNTEKTEYIHEIREIKKDQTVVRTNHGLWIEAGYKEDPEDEHMNNAWKSSTTRLETVQASIKTQTDPYEFLNCMSSTEDKNPQMNPVRMEQTHGKSIMRTTGQLLIIPSEMTLYYRPIWCHTEFDFDKINHPKSQTYFQILSSRSLFSECLSTFKDFYFNK